MARVQTALLVGLVASAAAASPTQAGYLQFGLIFDDLSMRWTVVNDSVTTCPPSLTAWLHAPPALVSYRASIAHVLRVSLSRVILVSIGAPTVSGSTVANRSAALNAGNAENTVTPPQLECRDPPVAGGRELGATGEYTVTTAPGQASVQLNAIVLSKNPTPGTLQGGGGSPELDNLISLLQGQDSFVPNPAQGIVTAFAAYSGASAGGGAFVANSVGVAYPVSPSPGPGGGETTSSSSSAVAIAVGTGVGVTSLVALVLLGVAITKRARQVRGRGAGATAPAAPVEPVVSAEEGTGAGGGSRPTSVVARSETPGAPRPLGSVSPPLLTPDTG